MESKQFPPPPPKKATITITFEKREVEDPAIKETDTNYVATMEVEQGLPLQVAINGLAHYLTELTQLYDRFTAEFKKSQSIQLSETEAIQTQTRTGPDNN